MSKSESRDPLLDEIREIRQRIWREHGNDPARLYEHYVELDRQHEGPRVPAPTPASSKPDQSAA